MSNERKLTEERRKKVVRLLESGTPENQDLAFSLIEQTASQEDIAEIFTMNVIVELICLNSPESLKAMVRAGQLILRCPETWERFNEAVVDTHVLTSQRYQDMLSKIDFVRDRYPSRSIGMDNLSLTKVTAISSGAAEQLMANEDDWSYGFERLKLGGLSFLSETVAKSISQLNGEIRLDGLTELSDSAAESLGQHQGKLSLKGLERLSDTATESLINHGEIKTNTKIRAQITKHLSSARKQARESSQTGQRVLSKQQTTKIRKLLRTKSSEQAQMAVQLLETSGASLDDVSDVFSTSIVSLIVNTWDVDVWNVLAPLLTENPLPKQEFIDLVCRRILTKSASSVTTIAGSLFNRVGLPLGQVLTESAALQRLGMVWDNWPLPDVTELSEAGAQLLVMSADGRHLDLDALSSLTDAAAEILSKHEGPLVFDVLTKLSDSAAESLSQHTETLRLTGLISLSDAAAESLSKHEGGLLELNNLARLTDAAAESLSKYKGSLQLHNLAELSDTAAQSLANKKPNLDSWDITLGKLPASAAKILRDAGHGDCVS